MCWWTNQSRRTSKILAIACAPWVMVSHWASSRSRLCSMAETATKSNQLVGEFAGVFTNADGSLFAETYNQLNAYFATVPGNYAMNLRQLFLLNTNYADLSFLFTILPGEKTERASRRGVPGSARNRQQHALLPQPA